MVDAPGKHLWAHCGCGREKLQFHLLFTVYIVAKKWFQLYFEPIVWLSKRLMLIIRFLQYIIEII